MHLVKCGSGVVKLIECIVGWLMWVLCVGML